MSGSGGGIIIQEPEPEFPVLSQLTYLSDGLYKFKNLIFDLRNSAGNLWFDADGIGAQAATKMALIQGPGVLSASDIFFI